MAKQGRKDRLEIQELTKVVDIPLGYPKHVASFETFYYLGESRSLRKAAFIRFQQLVPDCPESSPRFNSKFESFYTKIKRWSRKEDWNGWCIRKDVEERQKRDAESRSKMMSIDRTLKMYQSLVRQALVVWSDKIKASIELRKAIAEGDNNKILDLSTRERIEIKTFSEAKQMMELDMYLTKELDSMPGIRTMEKERLSEEHFERVDRVMEHIRKQALDVPVSDVESGREAK